MFVNTCSEKWMVAERLGRELDYADPGAARDPPVRRRRGRRTVLVAHHAAMHRRFPRLPF